MLSNINEYLFLRLKIPPSNTLQERNFSVNWKTVSSRYCFEVGKSYLPHTLLITLNTPLVVETKQKIFNLLPNSILFLNKLENYSIKHQNKSQSDVLLLFLGKDSITGEADFIDNLYVKRVVRNEIVLNKAAGEFTSYFDALRYDRLYLDSLHENCINRILKISEDTGKEINRLDFKKRSTKEDVYKKLSSSVEFIEDNYCQNISLEELAKQSGISKYHFLRAFKKLFSVTPYEYLSNLRITRAKDMLNKSQLSIAEISFNLGYQNASHFSFNFKKSTGCSPLHFRKSS